MGRYRQNGVATFNNTVHMSGSLLCTGVAAFSGPSDTFQTFGASDTTPSVANGNLFKTHASSQTLTMFDDGTTGQTITVISTAAVVFDVTSTNLKGGSANITTAAGDITTWTFDGTNWYLQQFMDVSEDMSSVTGGGGGATINSAAENRLLTVASDTSEMDAEANLTYNGTTFTVNDDMVVGSDGSGHDVTFYSATSGDHFVWDASEEKLTITGTNGTTALDIADGNVTITDDLSVDGTTNLDNTDIDGTFAVDGTTISLDATTSLNIDNSNTSNGITIGTATSGVPISIGHSTSETTINDNLTVTGDLTVSGGDTTIGTAGNTTATTISVISNTGTNAGKDLTISAGSSTTNGNNINGGNLILKAGSGDGTGTSAMTFFTKVNGTDAAAERMRIHTDGNVGIGTNAPGCNLHVAGDDVRIRADGDSNSHPGFELSENGTRKWIIFNNYGSDNLDFKTDSDIRMSIEQDGNVGIGNTNPGSLLEVSKTAANSEATRPTIEISSFSDADDAYTSAGVLKFHKSANDTINSYGAGSHTAAGEVIGRIEAWGVTNDDDGSSDAAKLSSYIEFAGDAVADETDVPGKIVFATADADDNGAPTVRLTIDDGGVATFTGVLDVDGTVDCDVTDFDVASSGDIDLVSTNNAASAIHIEENGGTSGTIKIYANQGNTDGSAGAGSILLASDDGGIGLSWNDAKDLWAEGGKFIVTANEDAAGCIKLHADAGSNQTIQIINDEGTETGAENEGAILLNATVGGIGLHGADDKTIWGEAGQIILTANQNTSDSIKLHADAGSSQTITLVNDAGTSATEGSAAIQLLASAGGINIKSNLDNADAILLTSDGGTSAKINIHNDQGTAADSINFLSDDGGVTVDAATTIVLDCPSLSHVHELTTNPLSIASYDTDGEGGGTILKYNPGTDPTTTLGGIYYLHTNGVWTAADADAVSSGASQLLGIAMGTSPRTHGMLTKGIVRIPSTEILNVPGSNASPGLPVYISTTAGHLDFTAPTGTSDYVRVVGYALQDNGSDVLIYFDPDPTWIELT